MPISRRSTGARANGITSVSGAGPPGWVLPGGARVDWLAAGTYDRSVGLSLFTLQITHKIEENTDDERDHVLATLKQAVPEAEVTVIRDFSTGYHARNGGGDTISTDGNLPVVDLTPLTAPVEPRRVRTDSRNKRPAPTLFGGVLVFFRGIAALILADSLLVGGNAAEAAEPAGQLLPAAATFIAAFGVGEVLLAWAFFGAETAPGFWPCFSARTPSLFRPPAHSVAAQELTSRQTFWASRWTSSSSSPSPANVPAPMHGIAAGAESHATASPPDRCEPGFNSGGSDWRQQRPVFRCGLRRRRSGGRFRACGRPQGDLTGL